MDYIVDAWFRTGRQETLSPVVRDLVAVARDNFVHAVSPLAATQSVIGYGSLKGGHLNNPNPMLQPVDLPAGAWEMVSPPPAWQQFLMLSQWPVVQIARLILILLMAGLLYLYVRRQSYLTAAANQRTQEIRAANQE